MSVSPVICFGQQPCGIFPKRFLVAKIFTARRLQSEIGGEIVFFYHDSDHDPRETKTLLRHRKNSEVFEINFTFENKLQRKYSPLYLKRLMRDWYEKTLFQLPAYVDRRWVDAFRELNGLVGSASADRLLGSGIESNRSAEADPTSTANVADFCLEMYRKMGLLDGMRVVRSSDPEFRNAACDVDDFFIDVPHQGEIVRARRFEDGSLKLHEGGSSFLTLPSVDFAKQQISPTRDSRLRWMQSVLHCTHYVSGASEQDYLRKQDAPEITYVSRDTIERSDEAYTDAPN